MKGDQSNYSGISSPLVLTNSELRCCGLIPPENIIDDGCKPIFLRNEEYYIDTKTGFIFDSNKNHIGFGHFRDGIIFIDQRAKNPFND